MTGRWLALLGWSALGCGAGSDSIDAAAAHDGPVLDGAPDAPLDGSPDARIDARSIDAPPCTFFAGVWETDGAAFLTHIAPATQVGFETRGDGVTPSVPGAAVPADEYLACCGVRLDVIGPPGVAIVWGDGADRSVRVACGANPCLINVGIDLTYVPPVSAAGAGYSGSTDVAVFAEAGPQLGELDAHGGFIGYEAAVRVASVEHTFQGGVELTRLVHRPCP